MTPMTRKIVIASIGVVVLVVVTASLLEWPLERAIYLAPLLVVAVLTVAGLILFWVKVAVDQIRETRRPRLWAAVIIGGIGVISLLALLGVELPRE